MDELHSVLEEKADHHTDTLDEVERGASDDWPGENEIQTANLLSQVHHMLLDLQRTVNVLSLAFANGSKQTTRADTNAPRSSVFRLNVCMK